MSHTQEVGDTECVLFSIECVLFSIERDLYNTALHLAARFGDDYYTPLQKKKKRTY